MHLSRENFKILTRFRHVIEIIYLGWMQELDPLFQELLLSSRQKPTFGAIWDSCYCTWVCGQTFFCFKRLAKEAKVSAQSKMDSFPPFVSKAKENGNKNYWNVSICLSINPRCLAANLVSWFISSSINLFRGKRSILASML